MSTFFLKIWRCSSIAFWEITGSSGVEVGVWGEAPLDSQKNLGKPWLAYWVVNFGIEFVVLVLKARLVNRSP